MLLSRRACTVPCMIDFHWSFCFPWFQESRLPNFCEGYFPRPKSQSPAHAGADGPPVLRMGLKDARRVVPDFRIGPKDVRMAVVGFHDGQSGVRMAIPSFRNRQSDVRMVVPTFWNVQSDVRMVIPPFRNRQ